MSQGQCGGRIPCIGLFFLVIIMPGKRNAKDIEVALPNDFLPLLEWQQRHYLKQVEFIMAQKNFWEVVFIAGNGTGKTHTADWCAIMYAVGMHPALHIPPPVSIKSLEIDFEHGVDKIFFETCMMDQIMPDGKVIGPILPKSAVDRYWSRDDRSIRFKNGSVLFFQTSEQKKRLHSGTNFDILICNEEPDYMAYDESKRGLRTAKAGGRILHAFTPPFDEASKNKGPTWTKFKLLDPWERGEDPDTHVVRAAMADNPAITDDYIRKFSKGKTEEELRIQLYGEYPTWGKLVFAEFQNKMWDPKEGEGHILPYDFEVPFKDGDVFFEMAVDYHPSKPPAIVWTFEYRTGPNKGDVIVWDELAPKAGKGMTISDTANAIKEVEGYRKLRIRRFGDPKMKDKNNMLITGFNAWEEFRHCGIRLSEGWNRQPEMGYSVINDFLRGKSKGNLDHPRLFIRENCKTLIHNMSNHYWMQKESGIGVPDPKFSDYCVSLRYIMQAKARKIKKNLDRPRHSKWGLTSYLNDPAFSPYAGYAGGR